MANGVFSWERGVRLKSCYRRPMLLRKIVCCSFKYVCTFCQFKSAVWHSHRSGHVNTEGVSFFSLLSPIKASIVVRVNVTL